MPKDPLITAYLPAVLESKTISKACLIDLFNVTKVFKFIDTFGSTGGAKRRKKLKKCHNRKGTDVIDNNNNCSAIPARSIPGPPLSGMHH